MTSHEHIKVETFAISGMTCANCSARIEKELNNQEGVKNANVNLARNVPPSNMKTKGRRRPN